MGSQEGTNLPVNFHIHEEIKIVLLPKGETYFYIDVEVFPAIFIINSNLKDGMNSLDNSYCKKSFRKRV